MMNAPYALRIFVATAPTTAPMCDSEKDRADLAGTRMLIAEESFDAIVQMLIDAGLVSRGCAAVMLDRLSSKLLLHASGRTETQWGIRPLELRDQASRLATKAVLLRCSNGGTHS